MAVGALRDLFAATEAVGDDQAVGRGLADRGQKFQFADRDRDVVLLFLEAERAGHAATARRWSAPVDAHLSQNRFFIGHFHQRFVMAVAMDQGLARQAWEVESGGFLLQKFAQQKCLPGKLVRPFILGEEIEQFVAEDGGATGLQNDDGNPGFDFGWRGCPKS